jgi:hypothetical protein
MFDHAALLDQPDVALSERVVELAAECERLQAELLLTVAAWDGRRAWAADGAVDPRAWLSARAPMTGRDAHRVVRSARLLRRHDRTAKTLAAGDITTPHVDALARAAANGRDELYAEHEDQLLDAATTVRPREFEQVAARWRMLADDVLSRHDAKAQFDRRHIYRSKTFGGMGVFDTQLDPEATEILAAALDAFDTGPDKLGGEVPPRTHAQRRADALIDLCRAATSKNGKRPGVTTRIDVVVDEGTLAGQPPADLTAQRREFLGGAPIAVDTFFRMVCDGEVGSVMLDRSRQRVDLGRATRVVSRAQRRALAHRDGGCRFRDCDRPDNHCDAHHMVWWRRGGSTDLDNLVLLCRRHHVLVHEGGWHIERNPATGEIFVLPPGHGRAPPRAA